MNFPKFEKTTQFRFFFIQIFNIKNHKILCSIDDRLNGRLNGLIMKLKRDYLC